MIAPSSSLDLIFIDGLVVHTIIGVYAWEQQQARPLRLFLELYCDCQNAAGSDEVSDTIDYKAVCEVLIDLAATTRFSLLESFADEALRRLFQRFAIEQIRLRIEKPGAVAEAETVGVQFTRSRLAYCPPTSPT